MNVVNWLRSATLFSDAATRARIADVLRDAGKHGEIIYLDSSELHDDGHRAGGKREVRVIRKEVDVTNQITLMLFVS